MTIESFQEARHAGRVLRRCATVLIPAMLAGGVSLGIAAPAMADSAQPNVPTMTLSPANPTAADAVTVTSTVSGCGQGASYEPTTFYYLVESDADHSRQNWFYPEGTFSDGGDTYTVSQTFAPGTFSPGTYSYYAYGVNAPCFTDPNNFTDSATGHFTVFDVPSALSAPSTTVGDSSVALTWTAPSDNGYAISDYQLRWSTDGGDSWTAADDSAPSTDLARTVSGLANGVPYVFEVAAVNELGVGAWSDPSGQVAPFGRPAAPTVTAGDGTLQLAWPAAPGASGYQYSLDGGGSWSPTQSAPNVLVSGLVNGQAYSIVVRAMSGSVTSDPSDTATGTPVAPPVTPPAAPARPVVTAGDHALTITWTAVPAATAYQYSLDDGASWSAANTARSQTVRSLVAGHAYLVRVRALTGNAVGAASTAVTGKPLATPVAPARPTVVAGNHLLKISWKAVTGANGYQFTINDGRTWSARTTAPGATASGLTNGSSYQVRVRALNGPLTGAASLAATGRPAAPVVVLPPMVSQGTIGPAVKRLQQLLGITADGIFGPQTGRAVRGYQAAHHLAVDGIVGTNTWKSLLHI